MTKQGVDHGFPLGFAKTSGKRKKQAASEKKQAEKQK